MSTLDTSKKITQDVLRRALGLPADWSYVWDVTCMLPARPAAIRRRSQHRRDCPRAPPWSTSSPIRPLCVLPPPPLGMLVDVLDQRRPPHQLRELAHPRVLRYLKALPSDALGSRGGARLLSPRAARPHEGSVEVAASVRSRVHQGGVRPAR